MAPKPSVSPKPAPSPTTVQPKPAAVPAKPTPVQRQGIYHSALIERAQYVLVIYRRKSLLNLHVSNFFTVSILSRAEQQAIFLQDRQLAFKKAALQAKTNGDMELAKKYLRMAKVGHNDCSRLLHEEPNTFGFNKDLNVFFKYTNKSYSDVFLNRVLTK